MRTAPIKKLLKCRNRWAIIENSVCQGTLCSATWFYSSALIERCFTEQQRWFRERNNSASDGNHPRSTNLVSSQCVFFVIFSSSPSIALLVTFDNQRPVRMLIWKGPALSFYLACCCRDLCNRGWDGIFHYHFTSVFIMYTSSLLVYLLYIFVYF